MNTVGWLKFANYNTMSHIPLEVYFCSVFGLLGLVIVIFAFGGTRQDAKISMFWAVFGLVALIGFGGVAYTDGTSAMKVIQTSDRTAYINMLHQFNLKTKLTTKHVYQNGKSAKGFVTNSGTYEIIPSSGTPFQVTVKSSGDIVSMRKVPNALPAKDGSH